MATKIKFQKPKGFFDIFERRPGSIKKNMHYCPGCGHGILHKLIAEAVVDLDIMDKTIFICPVGCSVFAYYYFDFCGISVPHGRAPAVATGLVRANPESMVISYQGDGDLGAIGFNNFIQAANRGENMTVCFVNNAIYGMTG
ncbi:MAG: 2-oxoglutarate oxidoreductase, partial [Victivallales bacterium]|nr:2-oxoglutarate oxidoreductase [Victivallales bacterium]